jgi:predicted transcriptional regulator
MTASTLGDQELAVLRHIAMQLDGCTVGEVAAHFAQISGLARTTVLTVMERLRAKRYLTRRKDAGVYRYACSIPQAQLLRGLVRDFMTNILDGSVQPFVAYLAEEGKLSDDELGELKKLVQELDTQAKGDQS